MAISLKKDGNDTDDIASVDTMGLDGFDTDFMSGNTGADNLNDESSKFHGGIGDGTVSIDRINDLPTYTGPSYIPTEGAGVSNQKVRSIVYKIIGAIFLIAIAVVVVKGVQYLVGSGGKDITNELAMSDSQISADLHLTLEDDPEAAKSLIQYSYGTPTVKSDKGLNIVYIDGIQVGVNTTSRSYTFYGVSINQAEKDALREMTYQYDEYYEVITDDVDPVSNNYIYYNEKANDCMVIAVNKQSARIVNISYYTDYKKITEQMGD